MPVSATAWSLREGFYLVEHLSERSAPAAVSRRLAEILDAVGAGVTVQDASLRLVYANRAAARLTGWASPQAMLAATTEETLSRFEMLDERGGRLAPTSLPARRVLAGETPEPLVVGFRVKATGEERWSIVQAAPLEAGPNDPVLVVTTFYDQTDQVRASRASSASERHYREIVESLPVVAWFADPSGALVAANARWIEYTGAMAISGTFETAEQVHVEDRAELARRWRAARDQVEALEATVRLRRHDGLYRWHLMRVVPSRGEAGVVQGWIGTATDIDDERRASLALVDSERQFHELTDNAPMLVWMSGVDGGWTFFNRGWLQFTGRSLDEEVGDGWTRGIHPEDLDRCLGAHEAALARRSRFEIEYRLRRHDGTYRWLLAIGVPRHDASGEFLGFVGSCVDIEELKRAGDLARLMADAGLRLDEANDLEETLTAAAALAMPDVADWCLIDLVEPDGSLRRAATAARNPERQAVVDRFRDYPTPADSNRPAARAVHDRRAILIEDLRDDESLRQHTGNVASLASLVRAMDARSAIIQPLIARGTTLGAMFFVVGPDRTYSQLDLTITGELAGRVALAIANAKVHAAEQDARREAEAAADRVTRLQSLTRGLAGASTRDAVADLVVREGRAALGASGAVIVMSGEDGLSVVASDGYDPEVIRRHGLVRFDSAFLIARAVREERPLWLQDIREMEGDDDESRALISGSPNRSACALPLVADGETLGAIGLSFAESRTFDSDEQAFIGAYADLCSQALARATLSTIRESESARLEALLQQLPEGLMIAEAPSGRIVLVNDRLEEIIGVPASELHHIGGGDAYRGFDADGRELRPDEWPLARAVKGETVPYTEVELVRADGTRVWIAKRAGPVLDREGRVVAGVATIIDISDARHARENRAFLSKASELLGSSLDYEQAMTRIVDMAVPRIADWCAVDIVDEDGVPRRLTVAHEDPAKVALVYEMQDRYPADPDSERGLGYVLRTGRSDMMSDIPPELVEAAARDPEHLELLRGLGLCSYICVPIVAGGQVLGALSFAGADSGRRYGPEDLVFAEGLASRAASAISNARSFREAVRYKQILDATLDAVIMFDPVTLQISYANQGATDQLGYPVSRLIGEEATALVDELDAIGLRGLVAPLVGGTLDARTATLSYRHRDGHRIPVEVLLQHIAPPGEGGRIVAVARDISDRIEAQAKLRRLAAMEHARAAELDAVIRALGDGVFVCEADGSISLSNPAAEGIFPYVTEQTYADILAQVDDPDGLAPGLGTVGGPIELRAKDGDERWIELSTYPVARAEEKGAPDRQGETIVMLRDVTASRQRQAIRDTFIGVLSHELRTPVTTIFAGSKVLARDGDHLPPTTRQEIFSDIAVEAERLHRLVEDVIAMTRFGEDEGDVGSEPVLLQRILPGVIRSEETRWPGVSFVANLPAGLPTAVADPTYVEQVIRNLLSNAAKYGGAGTTVTVSVDVQDAEILVSISDDGPGFPADESERVFELFFRSAGTASAAAGAGIGLFVCARLVRAMGGRIWAGQRPGGGAEFIFTLRVMTDEG
ncbi:MAG TPA: PAS domain S-box protein [Candidatus Limnocylindrales bacterium]|jgi:PAS domain S-box-containing protein|nr:PAS domain S-box protein [Candidatus Limnocylindrales bacterium]